MALANGIRLVWLDTYIGQDEEYQKFKKQFQDTLKPAAALPPDAINVLIWNLEQTAPFLYASTPAQAIQHIETHRDKRVILISSGSLGKPIIPMIRATYPHVHSSYIFCGKMSKYADLVTNYPGYLQLFDHEIDLLVQLARDISLYIMEQGKIYRERSEEENSVKCENHALTLKNAADRLSQ